MNFDLDLSRRPDYGEEFPGTPLRGVKVKHGRREIIVAYFVDDEDQCNDLIEAAVV